MRLMIVNEVTKKTNHYKQLEIPQGPNQNRL